MFCLLAKEDLDILSLLLRGLKNRIARRGHPRIAFRPRIILQDLKYDNMQLHNADVDS